MKKIGLLALPLFFSAAAAFAQNAPTSGITESTDPSKVAEVERRAQELQSSQSSQSSSSGATTSGKTMSGSEHRPRHGAHHKPHHMHHGGDQSGGAMQGQGGAGTSQQ